MTRRTVLQLGSATAIAAIVLLTTHAAPSAADVMPGDVITRANAAQVKDLVSPGLSWCVEHGLRMTIGVASSVPWPPAYRDATEKYAAQVRLSDDGLHLEGYVAGAPFPHLDTADPAIAAKLVWNYNYKFYNGDDFDLRNFDADTGTIADDRPLAIERHFLVSHFRRLWYVNRLYVDPKPNLVPNAEGAAYKETLHPLIEPFDLKGVGFTYWRYLDPARQDDSWLYLPSLRRVRRLSTAQRSDALFGQDTDVDSYYGYSGQPAWMQWRYLGQREMLATVHAQHFPVKWGEPADWAFDDVWEKQPFHVVEGVSKLPQYAFSKRVLFISTDTFGIPYSDMYDKAGELWKIWINDAKFDTKPFAAATTAVYPYGVVFAPGVVMVDIQLRHATRIALPSHRFAGEEGWYYNFGEAMGTTEHEFTVAELIASGH
jgi:hypothetical protein